MYKHEFTLEALRLVLLEDAGPDQSVDLDRDILDVEFAELGYAPSALAETVGRIEREYGVVLDEDLCSDHPTPRGLIAAVNAQLELSVPA
ncbi:phosphopantetheine-binding protein [Streptomyces sp. CC210A]|uniref:phosphopantetheine-binding protein n=1 Tax=Streptomyces sp. CC210A TaxID=2898184 RepID=UPI001F35ECB2|nr:phosphopantetheine-binding protein [Streptomyces sp. CC210A]